MQPYTCQCGQLTQSADDNETARDAAESFATRYAGDEWDDEEPCSFPIYLKCEQDAADRVAARQRELDRVDQRAEAKRRDAAWRAGRRRAARRAAS